MLFQRPATPAARDVAVLICPPFGWDDVQSYRSRRAWSQTLVDAGYPTARIDLPGTGDSGGSPSSPGRLDAWTDAVSVAARWLREETGCGRIAAVGLGLGGFVAYTALARDGEIDDLVLWAVPARGRALVRELRAASLIRGDADAVTPPDPTAAGEGSHEFNGFVMTGETIGSLERVDLTELTLPEAGRRRVLMLGRDGVAPDSRLQDHLERTGVAVSVADGRGYGLMMRDPRLAQPPREVFAQTISWLAQAPSEPPRSPSDRGAHMAPHTRATLELTDDGHIVHETPYSLQAGAERLFGILSEPAGPCRPVTAVLFNAGGVRRIGPNRMWVETARSWAARGVPTLRVDLRGVGDSDGDERPYESNSAFYVPELTAQAVSVLDSLVARGLPDRFILGGLCSGAYWSFRGAGHDERVIGAFMINLATFSWDEEVAAALALRNAGALLRGHWPEGLTARNAREAAVRIVRTSAGRRMARIRRVQEAVASLDRLRDRQAELLLLFSADETLYDGLVRGRELGDLGRWPNLHLERIPGDDHTFRAPALQSCVRQGFDDALGRVLDRAESGPRLAAPPTLV